MMRKIRYGFEAILLLIFYAVFRLLPLDVASAIGGLLGSIIGPFTRAHQTAKRNLELAMPELTDYKRRDILSAMWENLGRVAGEYPHLTRPIMRNRITIEGQEHMEKVKISGKGSLFVSGHFANWEIAPLTASLYGLPLMLIYRAANNPVSDWAIRHTRAAYSAGHYNKGRQGAQQALKALKNKKSVGMLVDQKMNDGEPIPFFGRDAMTATAMVQLAVKQQVPVLVVRVVRTDGAYFHVSVEPPVYYTDKDDPRAIMLSVHALFERWIREHPAQWFWVHNRWGRTLPN